MRKIGILMALAALLLGVLACGFSASTANLSNVRLARDEAGEQVTTVFAPTDTFYCLAELNNAPDDTTVKATWTAVAAEGVDANFYIDESEITSGDSTLTFDLANDTAWPVGQYKVDLYLNDELKETLEFEVQE